ncbi:MAG: transposase DNA-binding-containing protein [Nostoc sp. SerVER01]|nr:transposase DNA-binding-containing protein [Nostoc sp. SerVER01]
MLGWWEKNFATCELGDRRLNERAMSIGYALSQGFGKALSEIFNSGTTCFWSPRYLSCFEASPFFKMLAQGYRRFVQFMKNEDAKNVVGAIASTVSFPLVCLFVLT